MKINTDPKIIDEILTRGVENAIVLESLRAKLLSGKRLRVKFGIDPTSSDLHIGHGVALRKLRAFQDLGHTAVLIIGDFTAMIGDPTGKSKTRPILSEKDIKINMKDYIKQASLILDIKKVEVVYNSKWLKKLPFSEIYRLSGLISVNQMLQGNYFGNRFKEGQHISMHEFFYPLMQAYDSVEVKADIEIGGSDQLFNILTGRNLMEKLKLEPQDIMTFSILEGTGGKEKMSKSLGNYISLKDDPSSMFGKVMSINDSLIIKYFTLCTNKKIIEIEEIEKKLNDGENPRNAKVVLAEEIVSLYHGINSAKKAKEHFEATFSKKEIPENIPEVTALANELLSEILLKQNIISSKSDFARLIKEGAVTELEGGRKITDLKESAKSGTYKIGKHRFIKIVAR